MYYEEKFINGYLMFRSTPDGKFIPVLTKVALMANQLHLMSEADRESVFNYFCKSCGSDDPKCQCWNDE